MKIARVKFMVKDGFEPGDCVGCPIYGDESCALNYRFCDCPIELDDYSYAMDEEDITD